MTDVQIILSVWKGSENARSREGEAEMSIDDDGKDVPLPDFQEVRNAVSA